ncbi:hypothetical protein NUACC21_64640 [Scytonema sp. NUACC21]
MKIPKTLGVTLLVAIAGTQNPAAALVNDQAIQPRIALLSPQPSTTQQSNLVSINNTYWGPQRDFEIWMPGQVKTNERNQLTSWSAESQIAYVVVHKDMPSEVFYLSTLGIRHLLQTSMRENIAKTGKVVRSTNLVINGYPGLELLAQNSDGTLGQYQAFLVKGRMYLMGAVTQNELTTEAVNFFNSFRVYPENILFAR